MKQLIKRYLKSLTKQQRDLRMIFRGKRLLAKQHYWLHFNRLPHEEE